MQEFHSKEYPGLKRAIRQIGQDLSTPDFKVTVYAWTKAKETQPGSAYAFQIKVVTPDEVSEEEVDRRINEKDWQDIMKKRLCEHFPGQWKSKTEYISLKSES